MYCDQRRSRLEAVSRHSAQPGPRHDEVRAGRVGGRAGGMGTGALGGTSAGTWGAGRHKRRRAGRWGTGARLQARGAGGTQAWARHGRAAGPAGCALSLF